MKALGVEHVVTHRLVAAGAIPGRCIWLDRWRSNRRLGRYPRAFGEIPQLTRIQSALDPEETSSRIL